MVSRVSVSGKSNTRRAKGPRGRKEGTSANTDLTPFLLDPRPTCVILSLLQSPCPPSFAVPDVGFTWCKDPEDSEHKPLGEREKGERCAQRAYLFILHLLRARCPTPWPWA